MIGQPRKHSSILRLIIHIDEVFDRMLIVTQLHIALLEVQLVNVARVNDILTESEFG